MSKVLVTGASGFVGSHLAKRLAAEGHEVVALARPGANLSHLDGTGVVRAEGDILDPASLDKAMSGCAAVFHAAAALGMWKGVAETQDKVNVTGTRLVCEAALRAGVKRLVHTSSVAAIGLPQEGTVADERTPFTVEAALSDYARTKQLAEIEVCRAVEAGLDAVTVNPGVVFGLRPNRHYAANLFEQLVAGKVPAYPLGGACWVWVEDVVEGELLAWRKGRKGERYILGNENLPYGNFMRRVCALAGSKPPRLPVPRLLTTLGAAWMERRAAKTGKHPLLSLEMARLGARHLYYDSGLARRELGFTPRDLETAVKALLKR